MPLHSRQTCLPAVDTVSGEESGGAFDGNAPIDTQLKVRQVLGKWQKAWEEKDLSTYMGIYSERAQITRVTVRGGRETSVYLTKRQLQAKMQQINNIYAEIQVSISNLQVNGDRAVADVQFLQKFVGTRAKRQPTRLLRLRHKTAESHGRSYRRTLANLLRDVESLRGCPGIPENVVSKLLNDRRASGEVSTSPLRRVCYRSK